MGRVHTRPSEGAQPLLRRRERVTCEMRSRRATDLTDAANGLRPPLPSPEAKAGRRSRLRILLVEDNPDHMMLARRALEERGHIVTTVLGSQAALVIMAAEEFDAVALDYQLPDATGLQALEAIRRRARTTPVVMVTAWGSEQVAVEALKKGTADYVVKAPGYEQSLADALEVSVRKARTRRAQTALKAQLTRRARTDPLTGLLNRREMERLLDREINRARRTQRAFSFGLADVDMFKAVNDTRGHVVGDAVLRHIAQIIQSSAASARRISRAAGAAMSLRCSCREWARPARKPSPTDWLYCCATSRRLQTARSCPA